MNEALRAQMLEETLRLLREALSSGKVVVKGFPSIGAVHLDGLSEETVRLLAVFSA